MNTLNALSLLSSKKANLPEATDLFTKQERGRTSFKDNLIEASYKRGNEKTKTKEPDRSEENQNAYKPVGKEVHRKFVEGRQQIKKADVSDTEEKQAVEVEDEDQIKDNSKKVVGTPLEELLALLNMLKTTEDTKTTLDSSSKENDITAEGLQKLQDLLAVLGAATTKLEEVNVNVKTLQETVSTIKSQMLVSDDKAAKIDLKAVDAVLKDLKKLVGDLEKKDISFQELLQKVTEAYDKTQTVSVDTMAAVSEQLSKENPKAVLEGVKQPDKLQEQTAVKQQAPLFVKKDNKEDSLEPVKAVEQEAVVEPKEKVVQGQEQDKEIKVNDKTQKNSTKPFVPENKLANQVTTVQNDTIHNQKTFEVITDGKVEKPVVVTKADILNQIVKKASVTVNEGHSEIQMKLEPESLGKLSLKLSVEKGLITAKFVAESQQVKEVIETNFNQLKDLLQEKGISVQSFSVSVGQENQGQNQSQTFATWKESMKTMGRNSVAYSEDNGIDHYETSTVNPYNYHEGRVDYKA